MTVEPRPRHPPYGSCLRGGVRFEVTASFFWANHCHCSRCRKHSGTFGGTQGHVPRDGFRLLGGDWPEGDEVAIRLGSLDGDPGIRPEFHVFVASRAPWDEIPDDGLPRFDEHHL